MTEQPEQVLNAELSIFIFNTHNESEIDTNPGGLSFKLIAKELYRIARDYDRMHREQLKKEKQERYPASHKRNKPEED